MRRAAIAQATSPAVASRLSLPVCPGPPPEAPPQRTNPDLASEVRMFRSAYGPHLFVADGSRVYDLDPDAAARVERLLAGQDDGAGSVGFLRELLPGPARPPRIDRTPPPLPALHSISLNVAQACNMSCGYCYADEGRFGGRPRRMGHSVARATVERLIAESEPGSDLVLGFMGGEPLLHRELVHATTRYAARRAQESGRSIRFSITTNGTLISAEDAGLFSSYPFSVQLSIDGNRDQNDAARPMNDGSSSYDRVVAALALLGHRARPRHLSARVTVTPRTGELLRVLDHLVALGFDDVGFAAVLVSPRPEYAFSAGDFPRFLGRMTDCGEKALRELRAGRAYPFGNLITALREIHRGTHRPFPCGAGAGYLSVNVEGRLYACHRLIDDPAFAMGDVRSGSDREARAAHLAARHVDGIEPCRGCWARYLCGGGCYHEVTRRGRPGCDYIRGWLDFCLRAYAELSIARPAYFQAASAAWPADATAATV